MVGGASKLWCILWTSKQKSFSLAVLAVLKPFSKPTWPHQGAPTASATLIATVPKFAYFAVAFRFLAEGPASQTAQWSQMLATIAVLSVVAGQRDRHRADQPAAHARVFGNFERRFRAAGLRLGHRWWLQPRCTTRLPTC